MRGHDLDQVRDHFAALCFRGIVVHGSFDIDEDAYPIVAGVIGHE
jgi:hypothetical protein